MNSMKPSQARVKELLIYNRRTGVFTWRVTRPGCIAGQEAGSFKTGGYRRIGIDWGMYFAHHLAWVYVTGIWPKGIDHRDGNPSNNAFKNLREATPAQNSQNLKTRTTTASKLTGATPFRRKWQAQINVAGKYHYLGVFKTAKEAHQAYVKAKARLHLFQPRLR